LRIDDVREGWVKVNEMGFGRCPLCGIQKKPTHKQADLVFAVMQSHHEKPKEPVFSSARLKY